MAVTLNSDFVKEQKQWVKRAMKGRPLYFGLQAQAARKGKFLVSKKPGDVKPAKVKELEPYEGEGKDKSKAAEKNKVPGGASMGVCHGENGTLKLYFERGKAVPVAEAFVKFFVAREMKLKLVKKVRIAEVDQLPTVPDEDPSDSQEATAGSIEARIKELSGRSKNAGGDVYGVPDRLKHVLGLAGSNPGQADDVLDEIEFLVSALERVRELQERLKSLAGQPGVADEAVAAVTRRIAAAVQKVKAEDLDGADENLDAAEQSLEALRKVAGPPKGGAAATETANPPIDNDRAAEFFTDWLEGIKPDLKTLKDAGAGELAEIGEQVKAVSAAVGKQDWTSAADAHRRADALLTAAISALRRREASSTVEAATAEFRANWQKAIAEFRASLGAVDAEMSALADALVETDDDELYWVAGEGLPDLLRDIRDAANGILQVRASTPGRTAASAKPLIQELRNVAEDQRVAACDANEFGVSTRIRTRLDASLELLENALDRAR